MEAQGERRYSSYLLTTSVLDGVSGQRHTPAVLYPLRKDPQYPLDRRLGGPQSQSGHNGRWKILCLRQGSNPNCPVVQSVARHYTDWATLGPMFWNIPHQKVTTSCFSVKKIFCYVCSTFQPTSLIYCDMSGFPWWHDLCTILHFHGNVAVPVV
jgi:hypothetical protein